jgi:hypothetical protein
VCSRGSTGVVHTACFAQWMMVQQQFRCEVCLTRFGPCLSPEELSYYMFVYNVCFGFLYYCLVSIVCAIYWITQPMVGSFEKRISDVSVFMAIVICVHPVLATLACTLFTVHHYVFQPFAENTTTAYARFLQRHGDKL